MPDADALAERAEAIFGDPPFPAWSIRDLILRLVEVADSGNDPDTCELPERSLDQLVPDGHYRAVVRELVDHLTEEGVLQAQAEGEGGRLTVRLAASVLPYWDRLRRWIREDADRLRQRQQLEGDAAKWIGGERAEAHLRTRGPSLSAALALVRAGQVVLTASAREYVDACAALTTAEQARRTRAQGETRRLIAWLAVVLLLSVVALVLAVVKSWEANEAARTAQTAMTEAQEARQKAMAARQSSIVAAARGWANEDPNTASGLLREVEGGAASGLVFIQASLDTALVPATTHRLETDQWLLDADLTTNGALVVTAGFDGALRLWDLETNSSRVLAIQEKEITCLALTSDDKRVVTGSADRTIRVWDLESGEQRLRIQTDAVNLSRLALDPTDTLVAIQTPAGLSRFSLASGAADGEPWPGSTARGDVSLGPGGLAAWATHAGLATSGGAVLPSRSGFHSAVAISPDGAWLAARDSVGRLDVWRRANDVYGRVTSKPLRLEREDDGRIEFSPDSRRMLVTNGTNADVYMLHPLRRIRRLIGHTQAVNAAHFGGGGRRALTVSDDGTARVWDITPQPPVLELFGHKEALVSADFAPSGDRVVTGSLDGTVRTWSAATGEPVAVSTAGADALAVHYSPDGAHIAVGREGPGDSLQIYAADALDEPTHAMASRDVRDADFSPDGNLLVVAAFDSAEIWDWRSERRLSSFSHWQRGRWKAFRARFSPDGSQVATAAQDNTAHLFDISDDGKAATWSRLVRKHRFYVYGLDFHPTRPEIATTVWHYMAFVIPLAGGEEPTRLVGHTREVLSADYSPDGARLVTASADGDARIWTPGLPQSVVLRHGVVVREAIFGPAGERVVTASEDGLGRVWTVDAPRLRQLNLRRPTVCLSLHQLTEWLGVARKPGLREGERACMAESTVAPDGE